MKNQHIEIERIQNAESKRKERNDPQVKQKVAEFMRQKRSDPEVKKQESELKRKKRSDPQFKEKLNSRDKGEVILK